ncbi:MAG: hypothetical protein Q9227_000319 [Pyrenula ochraceoflavens]
MLKSGLNQEMKPGKTCIPSILSLATLADSLTPALIRSVSHQIKTFMFGGEDNLAALIQWLFYELARHAPALKRMQEEHATVLGSDVKCQIRSSKGPTLLSRLAYTTAIIKETLRLHPPAGSERSIPPGSNLSVTISDPATGEDRKMLLDGSCIYINHMIIHRNPFVWGPDAGAFRPERFLDEEYMARIPLGAWRAFERGPRACIGKDLAMLEAKVLLVLLGQRAREGLRWEKVGYRGMEIDGQEEVFDINVLTHQPVDGMRMRFWQE